ncbi:hypothetical protein [Corynebacterium antarcticum]|uniref:hypothetical protein n=1 Tax=Corynebacterium antarcticum TaxID=2800405 RepID=UPI002004233E|nr:hypothetical protein [Corynebacterium antarcticum]MCK7661988.1 hypothetical protein [Corynebacterium antarcticum]
MVFTAVIVFLVLVLVLLWGIAVDEPGTHRLSSRDDLRVDIYNNQLTRGDD